MRATVSAVARKTIEFCTRSRVGATEVQNALAGFGVDEHGWAVGTDRRRDVADMGGQRRVVHSSGEEHHDWRAR